MKRYMFSNFFIDTIRNVLAIPNLPVESVFRQKLDIATGLLAPKHGTDRLPEKLERFLSFKPSDFCVVTEFHQMLLEVQDAYVCGHFYPALTGACCIGERIFNVLILKLRDDHKSSPAYKTVYRKNSFDNWERAIEVLVEWNVLPADTEALYRDLSVIRHECIHFHDLLDLENKASQALGDIIKITDALFGFRQDILFLMGHIFIKKDKESDPLVREFYIPASHHVGYKYRVENREGRTVVVDDHTYENREIADEEFIVMRQNWLSTGSLEHP